MIEMLYDMFDQMLEIDFNEAPNLICAVAIRDTLTDNDVDKHFANELVSALTIEVNGADSEQAKTIGEKFGLVLIKFIDCCSDNGFKQNDIVLMDSSQMNVTSE